MPRSAAFFEIIAVPFNMRIKSLVTTWNEAPALAGVRYILVMILSTPCFRELLYLRGCDKQR